MTREEDETLLAISRVVQEADGECDGDEYPKDVLRGVTALIDSLKEDIAEAKKQAEGLCDGCGESLDDAYCTKCLNRFAPSSPSEAMPGALGWLRGKISDDDFRRMADEHNAIVKKERDEVGAELARINSISPAPKAEPAHLGPTPTAGRTCQPCDKGEHEHCMSREKCVCDHGDDSPTVGVRSEK